MEDKLCISATNALSFFEKNGSSILSNDPYNQKQDSLRSRMSLKKMPLPTTVNAVAKVAKRFNSNEQAVLSYIDLIFKTCAFFKIQDIYQIAYIFASISHETNFGKKMEEDITGYIERYEPVFLNGKCVKKTERKYKELKNLELNFLNEIKNLYPEFKKGNPKDAVAKLHSAIDKIFITIRDSKLTEFLNIVQSADISSIVDALLLYYKKFQHAVDKILNKKLVKNPIIQKITKGFKTEKYKSAESALLQFYKLQLKVLLLDWLLTRIATSTGLGNDKEKDGDKFIGRGFIQLTGRAHYTNFAKFFKDPKNSLTQAVKNLDCQPPDLVSNFISIADPKIAAVIAVGGMKNGLFTGHYLAQYAKRDGLFDSYNARAIVNGDKDYPIEDPQLTKAPHITITKGKRVELIADAYAHALIVEIEPIKIF